MVSKLQIQDYLKTFNLIFMLFSFKKLNDSIFVGSYNMGSLHTHLPGGAIGVCMWRGLCEALMRK